MGSGFSRQHLQIPWLPINEDVHIFIREYDGSFVRLGFKNWQTMITKYCLLFPIFVGTVVVIGVLSDYDPKLQRLRKLYEEQCIALIQQDVIIAANNRSINDLQSSLKSKIGLVFNFINERYLSYWMKPFL